MDHTNFGLDASIIVLQILPRLPSTVLLQTHVTSQHMLAFKWGAAGTLYLLTVYLVLQHTPMSDQTLLPDPSPFGLFPIQYTKVRFNW